MKNSVYCVVPNWNGRNLLEECLDSLVAQSHPCQIIVVDNGSKDGSRDFVSKSYPEVILIERDKNYGFTGGVNPGIERAMRDGAEFVALFNNDAKADKDWLKHLVAAGADEKVGIVTSKFLRSDGRHLDSTGEEYSIWGMPFPRGRNEPTGKQYDRQNFVFAATGGATLYRTAMLSTVGLFDQDFFAYFEDVDISFRAQLAGWKVWYEPAAIAYHHVSATSVRLGDFARYHSAKNFLLLYAKNMPLKLYFKYLPLFMIQFSRMALSSIIKGKFLVFLKGSRAAIKLHSSTRAKRKSIQSARKVTSGYIDGILYHNRPPKPPALEPNHA